MLAASAALVLGVAVPSGLASAAEVDKQAVSIGEPTKGWKPGDGIAWAVARVGNMVILGGSFTTAMYSLEGATGTYVPRSRLMAVNATTGQLLPWAPAVNGVVRTIVAAPDGKSIYIGGDFTRVGTAARTNLAQVSLATGAATSFQIAAPNGGVRALNYYQNKLYVGGTFFQIGTAKRGGGAVVNPSTGALGAWNPKTNNGIYALAPATNGSAMFVGGPFTKVDGKASEFIEKVNLTNGNAVAGWTSGSTCRDASGTNPCEVLGIAVDAANVYLAVGGIGGRVTALTVATGAQRWTKIGDGDVQVVIRHGDALFAGGHFKTFAGTTHAGIVALTPGNGAVRPQPAHDVRGASGVHGMIADGKLLRIAGEFTLINGHNVWRYTSFPIIDNTAPTVPTGLKVVRTTPTTVALTWTASTDDVETIDYTIERNGTKVGTAKTTSFTDTGATPGRTYSYTVRASDGSGNTSGRSGAVSATTPQKTRVTVTATRAGYGNTLAVKVAPSKGAKSYTFVVQKLVANRWTNLKPAYTTIGAAETRSLTLGAGTYRVAVPEGADHAAGLSKPAVLTAPVLKVTTKTDKSKNKMTVNVDPNKGSGFYTFKVQQLKKGKWTTLKTNYKTVGAGETRTINLKKGTYRAVVAGKYGFKGVTGKAVTLKK